MKAIDQGDAEAQYELGDAYRSCAYKTNNINEKKDNLNECLKWTKKSAENGFGRALRLMGDIYCGYENEIALIGYGSEFEEMGLIKRNYKTAIDYYIIDMIVNCYIKEAERIKDTKGSIKDALYDVSFMECYNEAKKWNDELEKIDHKKATANSVMLNLLYK